MRLGAVFGFCKSYGAVRCCDISYGAARSSFENSKILRCGSVRFSKTVNATVRFGVLMYPTVGFGAVFRDQESYGAVRCGFHIQQILRCGSVL